MDELTPPENQTSSTTPRPGAEPHPAPGGRFRRNLVAIGAAAGLSLGGLGIAAAQTAGEPTTAPADAAQAAPGPGPAPADAARPPRPGRSGPGPVLAAAAKAIGISEADLQTALRSGQSIAQVAQSKGVDPKTVVDAMVAAEKARLEERTANAEQRMTEMANRPGAGRDGRGRHGPGPKAGLAAAARVIGVSEADLRTALRSGQTIAQVAQSKGVDVKTVIDAMVAEARARRAEEVKAGRLTQAQADEKTANLEQRITEMVNRAGGGRGPGGPRRP